MTKTILIGCGGHSKVIQDIVAENKDFELHAILDDAINDSVGEAISNIAGAGPRAGAGGVIYANTSYLSDIKVTDYKFCLAIGSNATRKKLFEQFQIPSEQYAVLIHPSAVISSSAKIGYGTVIMPGAVVNADAAIGDHCIINTNAVVEHDNCLEDFVHISPNAALCGAVKVGEGSHIGAGAVVIPGKKIGRWSTVGAGSVVVKDVGDNMTVVGVPARILPQRRL